MGACSRNVPRTSPRMSARTRSSHSRSARSILLRAINPPGIFSSWRISRCSRVCGITPSSAATTSMARSTVLTPAAMVRTNFSCPGTSMMAISLPKKAKPRSVVIPRSFSSFNRSVSIPVSARTREVFPWSMCPAIPRTICLVGVDLHRHKARMRVAMASTSMEISLSPIVRQSNSTLLSLTRAMTGTGSWRRRRPRASGVRPWTVTPTAQVGNGVAARDPLPASEVFRSTVSSPRPARSSSSRACQRACPHLDFSLQAW